MTRADYDLQAFARALRSKRCNDPRGLRAIGDEIGVTESDLSRAMGGQAVSVAKVIAFCHWLGEPVERFYVPPDDGKSSTCSWNTVKHSDQGRDLQ